MNNEPAPPQTDEPIPITDLSPLKQNMLKRRMSKLQRIVDRDSNTAKPPGKKKMGKKKQNTTWGELYPLVDDLHSILTQYANIGIAGNNVLSLIHDSKDTARSLHRLFSDINAFANQLTVIRQRLKAPEMEAGVDDLPLMFEIYENLDALRVDITTVLTPLAGAIDEAISAITTPNTSLEELQNV